MATYVHNGSGWQELTGTDRPYVNVAGTFQGVTQIYARTGAGWQQVYEYDNTGPTVPTPTTSPSGSSYTVSWGAITDSQSGVASATVHQTYIGSVSGFVAGSTYSIPGGAFGGGSTTFSTLANKRNVPGGETWQVTFQISATDNAGNYTPPGAGSIYANTRPLGDFVFVPAYAQSWSGSAWWAFNASSEGILGISTSAPRASGVWTYNDVVSSCKGFAADSGVMYVQRAGAAQTYRGNTGTFSFRASDATAYSIGAFLAPNFYGTTATLYLSGNDAFGGVSLPADWLTAYANGTAHGAGLTAHDNQPGFLRGLTVSTNNNPFGIYSGTIVLSYT